MYENLPQEKLGDIQDVARTLPVRSSKDKNEMKQHYTPEQLEAMREAEKAIDPRDLVTQARMRTDHWAPQNRDDFAHIDPLFGKDQAYAKLLLDVTSDAFIPKAVRRLKDPRHTEELFEEAKKLDLEVEVRSFLDKLEKWCEQEPALFLEREPYVRDILHRYVSVADIVEEVVLEDNATVADTKSSNRAVATSETTKDEDRMIAGLNRVAAETGFSVAELRAFNIKNLVRRRVMNQTRMGKVSSMYVLTIAGNGHGLMGMGEGKATEVADAVRQATLQALRNLQPVRRYENRTIYGKIEKKVGGTTLEITAKPPGMELEI